MLRSGLLLSRMCKYSHYWFYSTDNWHIICGNYFTFSSPRTSYIRCYQANYGDVVTTIFPLQKEEKNSSQQVGKELLKSLFLQNNIFVAKYIIEHTVFWSILPNFLCKTIVQSSLGSPERNLHFGLAFCLFIVCVFSHLYKNITTS